MRSVFKPLILLLFLFLFSLGNSSANNVDSLKNVLQNAQEDDTSKVNVLLALSSALWRTEPDEAIKYANRAKEQAESTNFLKGRALH